MCFVTDICQFKFAFLAEEMADMRQADKPKLFHCWGHFADTDGCSRGKAEQTDPLPWCAQVREYRIPALQENNIRELQSSVHGGLLIGCAQ